MKFLKSGLIVGIGAILSAFLKSKGYVKSSVAVLGVSAVAAAAAYYIGTFAATPISVAPGDSGFLNSSITASQTSITISPITKWVNGVKETGCFDSTEGVVLIQDGAGRKEYVYFPSKSCANNVTTLSSVTRGLNPKTTTGSLAGGTGLSFSAGSSIKVVDWAQYYTNSLYNDVQGTMTGSGRITSTQTTQTWLTPTNVTTAQRDAFTDVRAGDIIFNTTTGTHQYYDGSSWSNAASGALVNATTAVRGAVTLSSTGSALIGSGQGIGGSFNVLQALYTTSGLTTVKAGYVPVTEDTGYLSGNLLGASPTATTFLRGDQTWQDPVAGIVSSAWFGDGGSGSLTISSDKFLISTINHNFTSLTLNASTTLGLSGTNAVLVIKATGDVTINGTINLDEKGGAGGDGGANCTSEPCDATNGVSGTAGASLISGFTNGAGGAGGGGNGSSEGGSNDRGAGGGGGASLHNNGTAGSASGGPSGGAGSAASKIDANKFAFMVNMLRGVVCGGGGGGGGGGSRAAGNSADTTAGGHGGHGGGCGVLFVGGDLTLGASSVITVDGENGAGAASGSGEEGGDGGGGGGGSFVIIVKGTVTDNGVSLTCTGGSGTTGSGEDGGTGGDGAIFIYSIKTGDLISCTT